MSDRNWIIPTALWSSCVAFQFGSAVREWWTNREERQERRQSEMSEWAKVVRGEVKRGYRLWLEPRCCPYTEAECHYFDYVRAPLTKDGDDRNESEEEDMASVFMMVEHRMPNAGRYATVLRQYSIFTPNVYSDIAQVVYQHDPIASGWVPLNYSQLDERTVALMFKRHTLDRMCAIVIDVKEKSARLLEISTPPGIHVVLFVCRDEKRSNRLRIVYGVQEENLQGMITVDYEVRSSSVDPAHLIVREVANQSITIPGRRVYDRLVTFGMYLLQSIHPNEQSFVLKFDHRGNYEIDSYGDWLQNFNASILGRQCYKAVDDFKSLSPEIQHVRGNVLRGGLLHTWFKDVYSPDPVLTIAQRRLKVPLMKTLAAESICRARPMADLSMIKAETGVDIFDGIYENREKPMPTIRLIPDA